MAPERIDTQHAVALGNPDTVSRHGYTLLQMHEDRNNCNSIHPVDRKLLYAASSRLD